MDSMGKELIVFLVIFLVIGFACIAVRVGKKQQNETKDVNKDMDKIEPASAHSHDRTGKTEKKLGDKQRGK